jgi:hypothetical protein
MKLLEENIDKIDWFYLSENPEAIHLLEKYPDKIHWESLSSNPNAIHLLEQNLDKIDWETLYSNPNAVNLLEKNLHKIDGNWGDISENPNANSHSSKSILLSHSLLLYSCLTIKI